MIKLVVFDWNGALIADAKACMDAENHILKHFGRKPITMNAYRETVTIPAREFFLKVGFTEKEMEANGDEMQRIFHAYYEPRVKRIRTRRGARDLLEYLSGKGIEAIILSNHTVEGIRPHLKRFGIEKHFSHVLANDWQAAMYERNKRKRLETFLKKKTLRGNEIIIIGDSPEEVEVGRQLGLVSVAITGGYYSTRRLTEARPDHVINSLPEMIGIIKAI